MLRNNQKPSFTEVQLRQLKQTNEYLRRLTSDALREVRRIVVRCLTDRQYREAGQFFRTIATRMNSTLQVRREIITASREQQPELISVIFHRRSATCVEDRRSSNAHDEESASSDEALKLDPGYQTEADILQELLCETEERVSGRRTSRRAPPHAFFEGISRLKLALVRVQRHLRNIAVRQTPEIEVEFDRDGYTPRAEPIKNDDEGNGAMMSDASHLSENGGEL